MKQLLIVGAGGFGREVLSWLKDIPSSDCKWQIVGFLDDNPEALENYECDIPIVGSFSDFDPRADDCFVMAVGSPPLKLKVGELLEQKGAEFISLVHPSATIGRNVQLGRGCVICPNVTITCDVTIGPFVTINVHATVGHDVALGPGCTLNAHADVTGFVQLGKAVFVGSHGSILQHVQVGDFATIGAGSVVVRNVKPEITVFGVPAKKVWSCRGS